MGDIKKTRQQFDEELATLRTRMVELEQVKVDHKRAEEALQVSETRYRRLFETAQDGILLLDADTGQIDAANPFLTELLGYSQEALLGKALWEIGPFKNIAESRDAFLELQTKGYVRYEDMPLEASDGRLIDVEFVSNVYLVNHSKVIQCNIRDITARKRAEEALQASETRYRRLFETAQDGILLLDANTGQIDAANPFLLALLGYSLDELLGKTLWEIGPFKNIAESRDAFLELQTKGYVRYEDLPLETSDGRLIDVEFVSNVYLVDHSKVIQCNIRDITIRKQMEGALRRTNLELQARNEELDAFGHTVAHDLKNPLSVIVGYADILTHHDYPLSEEDLGKIGPILLEMALKMDSIIEELMLLSGLRKAEVKMRPLDMAAIVAEAQKRLAYVIEAAGAELVCPAIWPQALGYAHWVEEVWINYISNAVKYGGRPPHVELGASQKEKSVRFWVHDNGPGLTPDERSRLFAPFEQLEQTRMTGHGLGLSIVRRIVEKMGGQVSVASDGVAGEGSTFSFTLPIA